MQLVLEVCSASGAPPARKTFDGVGGVIGRGTACDWVIPDTARLISSHHGLVSFRGGHYFLTDISSNGIGVSGSLERLRKGHARQISDADVYQLGALEIRARLIEHQRPPLGRSEVIPDDAFLGLDPIQALDREQRRGESSQELEALNTLTESTAQAFCPGTVDQDHLVVPQWAEPVIDVVPAQPVTAASAIPETFWAQFGEALGMEVGALDTPGREALAIKVAGLFRQAIEGLQQSLRTRDELSSEVHLDWTSPALMRQNPLVDCPDVQTALTALLGDGELGHLPPERAVAHACRDLQIHQLALVVACRAVVRSALAVFAPGHLLLCFEREGKPPRLLTDGAHWRAYQRYYRRLTDEASLGDQLLRNDFCKAYEEQVRLVSSLHAAYPG